MDGGSFLEGRGRNWVLGDPVSGVSRVHGDFALRGLKLRVLERHD